MKFALLLLCVLIAIPVLLYSQFHVDTLARFPDIDFPVAISFPPDSSHRMFFTEKNSGKVRIMRNDTLLTNPFVTLSVANAGEQGCIGITFHPHYPDAPYVYIFYTRATDRANQVVRFIDQSNTGMNPETLMVVPRLTSAIYHNSGNLHFGPDGKLYVSIGDYAVTPNAQDTSRGNKRGKIHRLNPDGTIPSDNPISGSSMYSYGHRNGFDFAFDTLTGKMYESENGPSCNDEINLIVPKGNYGWPIDGNCTYSGNPKYKKPMFYWPANIPSFTGITVYRGNSLPELYGKLLVTSYNYGEVYAFTLNSSGDSIISDANKMFSYGSGLNDIEVGPDGYLYLTNGTYDGATSIIRLSPPTTVPPSPVLAFPIDRSINQTILMAFQWQPSIEAGAYRIRISKDSLYSSLILDDSTLTDTVKIMDSLEYNTTYFWNVQAHNNIGWSSTSPTWSVKTIVEKPDVPILKLPEDSSYSKELTVALQWYHSPRSEMYGVQVSTDSMFMSSVIDTIIERDSIVIVNSLLNNTVFYWRVRAMNVGGTSEYSSWRMFGVHDSSEFNYALTGKWNIISIPHRTAMYSKQVLFPTAGSNAFSFSTFSGYIVSDSLYPGTGYWMKFDTAQIVTIHGEPIISDTIDVEKGWNLIGSIADTLQLSSLHCIPPNIVDSQLYEFNDGYLSANTIVPGKGYWLKLKEAGKIVLSSSAQKRIMLQKDGK